MDVPHIPLAVLFRPRSTWMAMADAAVALLKRLGAGDASIVAQERVSWRKFSILSVWHWIDVWCLMFDVWCLMMFETYALWYPLWICQAINWTGWLVRFCVIEALVKYGMTFVRQGPACFWIYMSYLDWSLVCPDLFLWSAWNLPRQEGAGTTAACECWGVFKVESVNWKWTVQLRVRKVNLMYVDYWILFSPHFAPC